MKILVTGGAGFIGSNVADACIAAGHRVWILDNEASGRKANVHPRAAYQKLDVRNRAGLAKLFSKVRFDVVNHHAAQIDVRKSVEDPAFDAEVNIIGLLNVLDAARRTKVKKVLFSSSGGTVYGECPRPATERSPERPLSPYGVAKLASEKYILSYSALYGLDYTIFRYANVYGPRQDPFGEAGVVAIFSKRLLEGQSCAIFGTGSQTRDFVFVGDVARANVLALRKGRNEIVNIGTGRETSVKGLYQAMAAVLGAKQKPLKKPARKGELDRSVLAIGKAKAVLGWSPSVSLREGLERTVAYFASGTKVKGHSR